jgi:hypothetical protein
MIGCGITLLAFFLRIASRAVGDGNFLANSGLDDILLSIAMLPVVGISCCSLLLAENGFGKDLWTLSPDSITTISKTYFFSEVFYIPALGLIKISVIITYLRIFMDEKFRMLCYILIGVVALATVIFEGVTIGQCTPISYSWTKWDNEHQGHCLHSTASVWANAGINILLDLIIVVSPMPVLWRMNMNVQKRILVCMMFGVGIFITVVSALRLIYLVNFNNSQNLTWDYVALGKWTGHTVHVTVD